MEEVNATLGSILVDVRTNRLKISLRKASDLIGISHNYLSLLEKGVDPRNNRPVQVTPEILKKIAEAYELPIEELLNMAGFLTEFETEKINLLEMLQSSKEVTFGDKVFSSEEKRKLLTIIDTIWGESK
ncbi:helix-turn-helix domain-containing protein [Bacillus salitolerans]|uniref:Helix-turn-helix domain-containing protein n=1 Tax=Bacillus salitolerans TaxID=1437434 RepID=A0ABW4LNV6_9BACI